eukprot:ANDGO_00992.mRNA.1 putative N-acetyltransferase san
MELQDGTTDIEFRPLEVGDLGAFYRLNSVTFPVQYSSGFYRSIQENWLHLTLGAFAGYVLVGAISCRLVRHCRDLQVESQQIQRPSQPPSIAREPPVNSSSSSSSGDGGDGAEGACEDDEKRFDMYVMTLGVLAPYRERGVGSALLEDAVDLARSVGCPRILLHVHVLNEQAVAFYTSRGFHLGPCIQDYYRRISPPHAHVLYQDLPPDSTGFDSDGSSNSSAA